MGWFKMLEGIYSFSDLQEILIDHSIDIGGKLISALFLLIVLIIIKRLGRKIIKKAFAVKINPLEKIADGAKKRKETVEKLALNTWKYSISILGLFAIIGIFIPLTTLIAGAGLITFAFTLASQSILSDIVKGFFIVFEDIFSVGDLIEVEGFTGTVLEIGIRSIKLQLGTGEIVNIPNSNIRNTINYSVSGSRAILDINLPYDVDLEKALKLLEDIADQALEKYSQIVSRPVVLGVQSLENDQVVIRILAEVECLQKAYVERELRKMIKLEFDHEKIKAPISKIVVYQGKE